MGQLHSAEQATFALSLAKIGISSRHVQRIAQEIGNERVDPRDHKVTQQRRRELPVRVSTIPEVVAVEVDGGHLWTRAADCGPGVHEIQNKENKTACLVTLKSVTADSDPQPEPPPSFREPRRVRHLVSQMKGLAAENPEDPPEKAGVNEPPPPEPPQPEKPPDHPPSPQRLVRTCVASMSDSHAFGPMMAAEAHERGFYQAPRKAVVGDGAEYNWSIQRGYFSDFEPITDFLHVLCYVFGAAWGVGTSEPERWSIYDRWLRTIWQGGVPDVIAELEVRQGRVGMPPRGETLSKVDPRRLVADAWSYFRNNRSRMDYPRYRREGLPITSSLAESRVGNFNARVKSRPQYWNRPDGSEPILQLRAAVLSEDERLERFFAQRPGNPHRCRKVA